MKKIIKITLFATMPMVFIACTSSAPIVPSLPDTPSFTEGKKDGCATATGKYTKNYDAFNIDVDYKNGWFYGRKNCNPAQTPS